jgi:hypothetical protein
MCPCYHILFFFSWSHTLLSIFTPNISSRTNTSMLILISSYDDTTFSDITLSFKYYCSLISSSHTSITIGGSDRITWSRDTLYLLFATNRIIVSSTHRRHFRGIFVVSRCKTYCVLLCNTRHLSTCPWVLSWSSVTYIATLIGSLNTWYRKLLEKHCTSTHWSRKNCHCCYNTGSE